MLLLYLLFLESTLTTRIIYYSTLNGAILCDPTLGSKYSNTHYVFNLTSDQQMTDPIITCNRNVQSLQIIYLTIMSKASINIYNLREISRFDNIQIFNASITTTDLLITSQESIILQDTSVNATELSIMTKIIKIRRSSFTSNKPLLTQELQYFYSEYLQITNSRFYGISVQMADLHPTIEFVVTTNMKLINLTFDSNSITNCPYLRILAPSTEFLIQNMKFYGNTFNQSQILIIEYDDDHPTSTIHQINTLIFEANVIYGNFPYQDTTQIDENLVYFNLALDVRDVNITANKFQGQFLLLNFFYVFQSKHFSCQNIRVQDNYQSIFVLTIFKFNTCEETEIVNGYLLLDIPLSIDARWTVNVGEIQKQIQIYAGQNAQLTRLINLYGKGVRRISIIQTIDPQKTISVSNVQINLFFDASFELFRYSGMAEPQILISNININRQSIQQFSESIIKIDGIFQGITINNINFTNIDIVNPFILVESQEFSGISRSQFITIQNILIYNCTIHSEDAFTSVPAISINSQMNLLIHLNSVQISRLIYQVEQLIQKEGVDEFTFVGDLHQFDHPKVYDVSFVEQELVMLFVPLSSVNVIRYFTSSLNSRENQKIVGLSILADQIEMVYSIFVGADDQIIQHTKIFATGNIMIQGCVYQKGHSFEGTGLLIHALSQEQQIELNENQFIGMSAERGAGVSIQTIPKSRIDISIYRCKFDQLVAHQGASLYLTVAQVFVYLNLMMSEIQFLNVTSGDLNTQGTVIYISQPEDQISNIDENTIDFEIDKSVCISDSHQQQQGGDSLIFIRSINQMNIKNFTISKFINYRTILDITYINRLIAFHLIIDIFKFGYNNSDNEPQIITSTNIPFINLTGIRLTNIQVSKSMGHLIQLKDSIVYIMKCVFKDFVNTSVIRAENSFLTIEDSHFHNISHQPCQQTNLTVDFRVGGTVSLANSNLTISRSTFHSNVNACFGSALFYNIKIDDDKYEQKIVQLYHFNLDTDSEFYHNLALQGDSIFYHYNQKYLQLMPAQFQGNLSNQVMIGPNELQCQIYEYQMREKKFIQALNVTLSEIAISQINQVRSGGIYQIRLYPIGLTAYFPKKFQKYQVLLPYESCEALVINPDNLTTQFQMKYFPEIQLTVLEAQIKILDTYNNSQFLTIKAKKCAINWNMYLQEFTYQILIRYRDCQPGEEKKENITQIVGENQTIKVEYCADCLEGYFSFQKNQSKCEQCQSTMVCDGKYLLNKKGGIVSRLKDGYWRKDISSVNIIPCDLGQCNGSRADTGYCNEGYVGPLCQTCDFQGQVWNQSYFQAQTYDCQQCSIVQDNQFKTFLSLLIFFFFVLLSLLVNLDGIVCSIQVDILRQTGMIHLGNSGQVNLPSIYNKILINHLQILSILAEMGLDPNQIGLGSTLSIFGNGIGYSTTSIDCFLAEQNSYDISQAYFRFICQILMPIIISAVLCIIYFIVCLISETMSFSKRVVFFTVLYIYLFLFSSISNSILSFLSCKNISGDLYLKGDLTQGCYEREHSKFVYYLIIPNFLLYDISIPWSIFTFLSKQKKNLDSFEVAYKFRIVYQDYTKELYYFEFVKMAIKISMALMLNAFSSAEQLKSQVIVFILIIYYKLVESLGPYYQPKLTDLDNLSTIAQITSIIMYQLRTDDLKDTFSVMIYVLIALINLLFILWLCYNILKSYFDLYIEQIVKFIPLSLKGPHKQGRMKAQTRKNWRTMKRLVKEIYVLETKKRDLDWSQPQQIQEMIKKRRDTIRKSIRKSRMLLNEVLDLDH